MRVACVGVVIVASTACKPAADPVVPEDDAAVVVAGDDGAASEGARAPQHIDAEPDRDPPPAIEGPVAVVNGVEIPAAALYEIYDLKVEKYHEHGREVPASADRRYRRSIAARLVYAEVLRQAAASLGLRDDLQALAERERKGREGIADWDEHLRRRGETDATLRAMYIAEQREAAILARRGTRPGVPPAQARQELKRQLLEEADIVDHVARALGPEPEPARPSVVATTGVASVDDIPECAMYLARLRECVDTKMPPEMREQMNRVYDQLREAWDPLATSGVGVDSLVSACRGAYDAAAQSMAPLGCSWPALPEAGRGSP